MTNKFDDRFAERHHEVSSTKWSSQSVVSSGTVIHEVVITKCCVIRKGHPRSGHHMKCVIQLRWSSASPSSLEECIIFAEWSSAQPSSSPSSSQLSCCCIGYARRNSRMPSCCCQACSSTRGVRRNLFLSLLELPSSIFSWWEEWIEARTRTSEKQYLCFRC